MTAAEVWRPATAMRLVRILNRLLSTISTATGRTTWPSSIKAPAPYPSSWAMVTEASFQALLMRRGSTRGWFLPAILIMTVSGISSLWIRERGQVRVAFQFCSAMAMEASGPLVLSRSAASLSPQQSEISTVTVNRSRCSQ